MSVKARYIVLSNITKDLISNLNKKGFFHLLSAKYILRFIGFASQLLVVKFLSPVELGQIKTIQSFMGVAVIIAGFGFNTSVLKMCSELRPAEQKAGIFKSNLKYSSISTFLTLVGLYFLSYFEILSPDPQINKWLPVFMLTLPADVFKSLGGIYLQALKKIKLMANTQIFFSVVGLISLVGLTYFFGFIGFIISSLFMAYIGIPILLKILKDNLQGNDNSKEIRKKSFYYAGWSMLANFVGTAGGYLDIFILNFVSDDRAGIGYYSVATLFILVMRQLSLTVSEISVPYLSEKSTNREEFFRVLKKYEKLMVLATLGVGIVSVLIVPKAMTFFYGDQYALSGTIFIILAVRFVFNSSFTIFGISVLAVGKMNYNFLASSISVPINFFITWYMAINYGIMGVAYGQVIAAFISLILRTPITLYALNKHFKELS